MVNPKKVTMRMCLLRAVVFGFVFVLTGCGGGTGGDSGTETINDLSGTWDVVAGYTESCSLTEKGSIDFTYQPVSQIYRAELEMYNGVDPDCTNSSGYEGEGTVISDGKAAVPSDINEFFTDMLNGYNKITDVIFRDQNTIEIQGSYDSLSSYIVLTRTGTVDDSGSFKHITVRKVVSFLEDEGIRASDTRIVHEDGFGNGGDKLDLGRVILTRINGGDFSDDICFAFDYMFAGTQSSFPGNATRVLYIDTDKNVATGMTIKGIGADVRLTDTGMNNTLISGYCEWNDPRGSWKQINQGSAGSSDVTDRVDGGEHFMAGIHGTSSLLNTDARGVIALEVLTSDNSRTEYMYDTTDAFDISAY